MRSLWGPDVPGPPSIPGGDDMRPWVSVDALRGDDVLALSVSPQEGVYFTIAFIEAMTRKWAPHELALSTDNQ